MIIHVERQKKFAKIKLQCPQSSTVIKNLINAGYPAEGVLYYRGGMHDWITLGLPVQRL